MLPGTLDIIRSSLKADPTVSASERARILSLIRTGPTLPSAGTGNPGEPRLISRAEAARRLSCSLRMVDRLAADGILRKRKLPGRVRAAGFLESEISAFITGQPQDHAAQHSTAAS